MATKASPKPQGTYEPTEAPPAPNGSRFALPKTSAGFSVPGGVAGVVAVEYGNLLEQRRLEAQAHRPAFVNVALKAVKRTADGFELVERGVLSAVPSWENTRPSLRWRRMEGDGGRFLDSFLLGEDAWEKGPDVEVFDALLSFCEQTKPDGRTLRRLNDLAAVAVAMRAGVSVSLDALPHIH